MIFGTVSVDSFSVNTHKDSYLLSYLTVVSARRPFLGSGLFLSLTSLGFTLVFLDLLYTYELIALSILSFVALIIGFQLGQLKLLSRDLRGSELSGVIWGRYGALQSVRMEIVAAFHETNQDISIYTMGDRP